MEEDESVARLISSIRERRRVAGLTQQELAAVAGVSVGVVRDLEQGVTVRPRAEALRRLAMSLGISTRPSRTLLPALPALPAARGSLWADLLPLPPRRPV